MINFRDIPEIAELLKRVKDDRTMSEWFKYPRGKKIQLELEVDDPELAQLVLGSSFSQECLVPGMKVKVVRFADLERKEILIEWMRAQISTLESKLNLELEEHRHDHR